MGSVAGRDFAENFVSEDAALQGARAKSEEFGCDPISPGVGAALRLLAAALDAKSVVEVGTGTGVSGLWLLRGMRADGVLTTVDTETEHQRAARASFIEAGIAPTRSRLIRGAALEVLPRLTDAAYDMVFLDALISEYPEYLTEALRLLRPGGVVAFDNMLGRGRVADASARDADTVTLRDLGKTIREHERLVPALLPVGDGLLVAVLTAG